MQQTNVCVYVNQSRQPDCVQTISKSCRNKLYFFMVSPRHGFCSVCLFFFQFLFFSVCSCSISTAMAFIFLVWLSFFSVHLNKMRAVYSFLFFHSISFISTYTKKNLSDLLHFLFHPFISTVVVFLFLATKSNAAFSLFAAIFFSLHF